MASASAHPLVNAPPWGPAVPAAPDTSQAAHAADGAQQSPAAQSGAQQQAASAAGGAQIIAAVGVQQPAKPATASQKLAPSAEVSIT